MTLWNIHLGRDGEFEEYAIKNSVIVIGWGDIPNLAEIKSKNELKTIFQQAYPQYKKAGVSAVAEVIWNFYAKINIGDVIVSPLDSKPEIAIGVVVGEYEYRPSKIRHARKVSWLGTFPRSSFDADIQKSTSARLTLSQIRDDDAKSRVIIMLKDFSWIKFYSEFADKLLQYKDNRKPLIKLIHKIHHEKKLSVMTDKFKDGTTGPKKDICPFTTMSEFNRSLTHENRHGVESQLGEFLGVKASAPFIWNGIPVLDSRSRWLYPYAYKRKPDHIDKLWNVFENALLFADKKSNFTEFTESFNEVIGRGTSIGMLTIGLFWIRPNDFLPLDSSTTDYLEKEYGISDLEVKNCEEYVEIVKKIRSLLKKTGMKSFPELSNTAYKYYIYQKNKTSAPKIDGSQDTANSQYTISNIIKEGCFVKEHELESIIEMLNSKKNIILQGPPGTGKTYLAKKLAYALIGSKSKQQIKSFQFHPNLSYEDFVRGWRPSTGTGGRLELVDGPFLRLIEQAKNEPEKKFVIVIEEINRGNPANVFGEMLTLLEANKRNPEEALTLSYVQEGIEPVYIPENLYVIGTMNVADRSIAMVDLALRRRFGFYDLEPVFGKVWKDWVNDNCGIDVKFLDTIGERMEELNKTIKNDELLGPHFMVGHSYLTPDGTIKDPEKWFVRMVKSEIEPLLDEYWIEEPDKTETEIRKLLKGFVA